MQIVVIFIVTLSIHVTGVPSNCLLANRRNSNLNTEKNYSRITFIRSNRNVDNTTKEIFQDSITPQKKEAKTRFLVKFRFQPTRTRANRWDPRRNRRKKFRRMRFGVTKSILKIKSGRRWGERRTRHPGAGKFHETDEYTGDDIPDVSEDEREAPMERDVFNPTHPRTTEALGVRTGPSMPTLTEQCDYYSQYCMRAYNTGIMCGRTVYMTYHTFSSYCMLDYVNCMEGYEVWQIAHYGPCFNITHLKFKTYSHYRYEDDYWLDGHVVDHFKVGSNVRLLRINLPELN